MDARAKSPAAESPAEEFVISREFGAPRALVFKVWTQAEHLKQWFSPKGFTVLAAKMDLRPGGSYHYGMRTPNGQEMWGKWVFREIVAPEKLVLVTCFSDAKGGVTRHPLAPDWPLELLSTFTFAERGRGTLVTVRWSPLDATEAERKVFAAGHDSMRGGWGGTMEQLTAYLASIQKGA